MNPEQVIDLLAIVQAGDNRTVGENDVILWAQVLAGCDPDDCAEAIVAHRRERPGVWLEPGHVVAGARTVRRERYERSGVDSPERTAQEQLWDAKATGELLPSDETPYARGLYVEFDPAGWPYGSAGTRDERAAAAAEVDARIEAHLGAIRKGDPVCTRAEAEEVLRITDRAAAEEFLISVGRAHVIDCQLGVQPYGYAEATRRSRAERRGPAATVRARDADLPDRAFSEPIHLPGGGL